MVTDEANSLFKGTRINYLDLTNESDPMQQRPIVYIQSVGCVPNERERFKLVEMKNNLICCQDVVQFCLACG